MGWVGTQVTLTSAYTLASDLELGPWRMACMNSSTILSWRVICASYSMRALWTPRANQPHLSLPTSRYKTWRSQVQKRGEKLPKNLQDHLSAPLHEVLITWKSLTCLSNSNTGNGASQRRMKKARKECYLYSMREISYKVGKYVTAASLVFDSFNPKSRQQWNLEIQYPSCPRKCKSPRKELHSWPLNRDWPLWTFLFRENQLHYS